MENDIKNDNSLKDQQSRQSNSSSANSNSKRPGIIWDIFVIVALLFCGYAYMQKDNDKITMINPTITINIGNKTSAAQSALVSPPMSDSLLSDSIRNDTSNTLLKSDSFRIRYEFLDDDSLISVKEDSIASLKVSIKYDEQYPIDPYEPQDKEWFAFDDSWYYNYPPIEYTEEELTLFTNILYRESRSSESINKEIDQYLVMICAIRRMHYDRGNKPPILCPEDIVTKCHSFTMPVNPRRTLSNNHWEKCKQIVKNVFHCNIPSYVPYVPHGTFAYWNSRIDTNMKQKHSLQKHHVLVASSVKDHHFFARVEYLLESEREYLSEIQQTRPNRVVKNISNGVIFKQRNTNQLTLAN